MNIVELEPDLPLTITPRSTDKPHVGELIHMLLVDLGVNKRGDPPNPYQLEKGFVWERLLSHALPNEVERPGELEMDGIILSPDGVGYCEAVGDYAVEEYKCTARSSNNSPDTNMAWMMQVKAYCRVVETCYCLMRVLHLNGDYRTDRSPTPKTWLLTFTREELDQNWATIVEYAVGRGLL